MIGRQILNYKIEKKLGEGGMGQVYLASNIYIDQKVAIKVLSPQLANNEEVKRRFEQEANLLASVDHPNIVKFLNYFENETGIYILMEYVPGKTLEEYINTVSGPVPEDKALDLFEPLLSAFTYAHSKAIIHRDIKPSNIMISKDGNPKVLDFGIARIIKESVPGMTKVGDKMGTAMYMSPEQVKGLVIDNRSDIYALGVVLHQMIAGEAPYDDTTMSQFEIETKVVEEKLPRTKEIYPYASDGVQMIIDKAVEKLPEDRYQDCEEFKQDLTKLIRPEEISQTLSNPIYKWVALIVGVLILAGGIYYWDYNRVKVRYYKDYVERWGVPEGIAKLSKSDVEHREGSYRFEYKQRKLQRFSRVNSADQISEHHDSEHVEKPDDMRMYYRRDGKLNYSEYLDRSGKVLFRKDYNQKLNVVIFKYSDEFETEVVLAKQTSKVFSDPFSNDQNERGQISRYMLSYDDKGFIEKILFAKFQNIPVGDIDGIFGRKYERDAKGRVIKETYIGFNGKPKSNKKNLCIKKHDFDANDNWIYTYYLDKNEQPSNDGNGASSVKLTYDQYGNRIKEEYFGINGEPTYRVDSYVAGMTNTYDEKGNIIEHRYLDKDGKMSKSNDGIAGYISEFDEKGNQTSTTYINENRLPIISSNGYATRIQTFDDKGNIISVRYKDIEDKICFSNSGIGGYDLKRDSLGNTIEFRAVDNKEELSLQKNGTNGSISKYDNRNNLIEKTSIDISGNPILGENSYATWKAKYDKSGNVTEVSYYDENGEGCLNKEDIFWWRSEYDEDGNEVIREFFGTDSLLTRGNIGYARRVSKFDKQGNEIERSFFDEYKKPLLREGGYAGYKSIYDERGNEIEYWYIDKEGGFAKGLPIVKTKYDNNDNVIERLFYDKNMQLSINGNRSYAGWKAKYNVKAQIIEKSFLDKNLKLINSDNGYAFYKTKYDEKGNVLEWKFFDENSQPAVSKKYGAPMVKYKYDEIGNQIYIGYFKHNGSTPTENNDGIHSRDLKYDRFGRWIEITNYDKTNSLTPYENGAGRKKMKYDKRGNRIQESYHELSDELFLCDQGYAITNSTFDRKGKLTSNTYFGTSEEPVLNTDLYHRRTYSYNDKGNITQVIYYNKSDNLCLNKKGFAIEKINYDNKGNAVKIAYFDQFENTIDKKGGYSEVIKTYNNEGIIQTEEYYKKSGALLAKIGFDEEGNEEYTEIITGPGSYEKKYINGRTEKVTTDHFNKKNQNNWIITGIDGYDKARISNGLCRLNNLEKGKMSLCLNSNITASKNFTLEAKIKINRVYEEKTYFVGLTWGNKNGFSGFDIDGNQYRIVKGKRWKVSKDVKKNQYNIIKVNSSKGMYRFYINGKKVYTSHSLPTNTKNFLGFSFQDCDAVVDYVKISIYK